MGPTTEAATAWPGHRSSFLRRSQMAGSGSHDNPAGRARIRARAAEAGTQPAESSRWAAPCQAASLGDLAAQPWAQPGPPPSSATPVDPSAPPPGDTQLTTAQYAQGEGTGRDREQVCSYFALEPSEPGLRLIWCGAWARRSPRLDKSRLAIGQCRQVLARWRPLPHWLE